jgi:crossover junction endodeoxyribonuclease RuvC
MPNFKASPEGITLGFDPGIALTGYGVLSGQTVLEYGVIRTPAHTKTSDRLAELYHQMQQLLQRYPAAVAGCEELFFAKNVTTAFTVGQARGIILLALAQARVPLVELTPLQVKQSVTGYGKADKTQVQTMVKTILQLTTIPKPDDAADALAVALATQSYAHTI